ncbi:MAG: DUF1294 domain-containing protein [Clostridia bacterium]|nr:DUF1294 domain-containing protein [Clostridia bacterium]
MKEIIFAYVAAINIAAAAVCVIDKRRAQTRGARRIRERTLWLISFAGGSPFMFLTMNIVRHKTLKKSFVIGLPALMVFQLVLILWLTKLFAGHIMFQ